MLPFLCFSIDSLKPANIFLDSLSNVKLGDYGLAVKKTALLKTHEETVRADKTTEYLQQDTEKVGLGSKVSADDTHGSDDLTRGVGTALYSAPEQGEHCLLSRLSHL